MDIKQASMIGFTIGLILGGGLASALWFDLANRWERIAKRLMGK